MNPVLLKPGSDRHSQVVLLGHPIAEVSALSYRQLKKRLREAVLESLTDLRSRYDAVICEGAGSPAEINLRETDIANMGLAGPPGCPFWWSRHRPRRGFRRDVRHSRAAGPSGPGTDRRLRGQQVPWRCAAARARPRVTAPADRKTGAWCPALGARALAGRRGFVGVDRRPAPVAAPAGEDVLRVAVVRFPRVSNFTDVDPLAAEPGVVLRFVTGPAEIADADWWCCLDAGYGGRSGLDAGKRDGRCCRTAGG